MSEPRVSIIIPTKNKLKLLKNCIFSLKANAGEPYNLIVIDGGDDDTWEWLKEKEILGIRAEPDWNFSKLNNEGAKLVETEFILLLNNDTIARKNFLVEMLKLMEDPKVGIVGAKLLYPDDTIQHTGVFFNDLGVPYHPYYKQKDSPSIVLANRDDEFDAVTGACLLTRTSLWKEVGGMCEKYCFNYEDVDYCLKAKEKGYKVMLAYKAELIHLEAQSIDNRTTKQHTMGENLLILHERWLDTGKIANLINKRINPEAKAWRNDLLNIIFVPVGKDAGIAYWRMIKPAKMLREKKMANVVIVQPGMSDEVFNESMRFADIGVYQSSYNEPILDLANMKEDRSFRMVYELDDHPVYLSPFAQVYRGLGTQEVKIERDGKTYWLWRDGENGFFLERNIQNITRQLMILSTCDLVTTTTDALKLYFETKNKNVSVLPNCIDFDVFKPMPLKKDGIVRIGWHGGDNHFHDILEVGKVLTEFVNNHDNVRLILFGAYYKGPFSGIDENKVEAPPWVHIEAFPYKLASLNLDIGLIPLANEEYYPFNRYKSDVKFCEYSALQVPSLVQAPREAYRDCIDMENSMTFSTNVEFKEKLEMLVKDVEFRQSLGKRAYDWCYENRNLEKSIHLWLDAYEKLAGVTNGDSRSGLRTGTATAGVQ